jgi:hypothetical protein
MVAALRTTVRTLRWNYPAHQGRPGRKLGYI